MWLVSWRKQRMLTQGPTEDPKCKLNISSFITLPHLLDCLISSRNYVSILLLLWMMGCLQCYHQAFIVFHCLGYWNHFVSDWHRFFKVFCKNLLFFCYFGKMNGFKHVLETSSWIKNSGSIANIWTYENTAIGSI